MHFPSDLLYASTHEWAQKLPNGNVRIGVSDFAQESLGDIVFVDLPQVGDTVAQGASFAEVESVKAVSEVYSPANGTVAAVNEALLDAPEQINQAPYDAWMIELENAQLSGDLLDAQAYEQLAQEEE